MRSMQSDQSVTVLDESLLAQRLREDVRHHVVGVDVRNRHTALVALLADEVVRDLDAYVLGSRALRRILRLANVARAVAPQFEDRPLHPQLLNEMPLEGALAHAARSRHIFTVVGAGGDVGVKLADPGHGAAVPVDLDAVAASGSLRIRAVAE